jgi:hypothetical protein
MNKYTYAFNHFTYAKGLALSLLLTLILFSNVRASFAVPLCQVLDKAASKMNITLDLFGQVKKSKVDKIQAFLWVDPEMPESATLVAALQPEISKLFGDFESNPLLMGMMANFLDKELIFRSRSISKQNAGTYKIIGQVSNGQQNFPANFNIASHSIGKLQSKFSAKVQSDNFQKILGAPGSAMGDFELLFKSRPELSKQSCSL